MEKKKDSQATEQGESSIISQIVKVIYAPHKAFKEIVQAPKLIGPILIIILFTAAYAASAYILFSRTYNEQVLPTATAGDQWTENSTLWTSNALVADSNDSIGMGYYGNKSIQLLGVNETQIWMQLANMGPVNCTGTEGYKNISLRLKMVNPEISELENTTIYLFSSQEDFFYYNLTDQLAQSNSTVWNNLTIAVGPGSDWVNSTAHADWANITSLKLEFIWLENTNVTIRLDGLYFRGVFKPYLDNLAVSMFYISIRAFTQFTVSWVVIAVLLFIMTRGFGAKIVWRLILILVGFALITMLVQAIINAAAFSTLPRLDYPFELISGAAEGEAAGAKLVEMTGLVSLIVNYAQIAIIVWTIALCSFAIRASTGLSLPKSALMATVAYFASMIVGSFVGV
jgi:hypothetical protein